MVKTGAIRRARWLVPALFVLGACAELPRIGGEPLPPPRDERAPVYRDLADIPEPPVVTPHSENQSTIQALTEDRARTAQAAENLRRQPFDQPDPATVPGF